MRETEIKKETESERDRQRDRDMVLGGRRVS